SPMRPRRVLALLLALTMIPEVAAQRQMERLDRGVVAVPTGEGDVFVSWRLLGTDPEGVAFDLYRIVGDGAAEKLNDAPLTAGTNYTDRDVDVSHPIAYTVQPRSGNEDVPLPMSTPYPLDASAPYLTVPLR